MKILKERVILITDIRQMLISNSYFTRGTALQYQRLFDEIAKACDNKITDEDLYKLANIIADASLSEKNLTKKEFIALIMFLLEDLVITSFEVT